MSDRQAMPRPGDEVPAIVREPTAVQLFQYAAVTWNAHRIHYDERWATEAEGYPGCLVQAHLHACWLAQAIGETWGPAARIVRLGWQNRGIAVPGDRLTITGSVTGAEPHAGGAQVQVELEERNQDGALCVRGWATVEVPA